MSIIITSENILKLISAGLIIFVILMILVLWDYYRNVYLHYFDIENRLESTERKLNDLIETLRNTNL